MIPHVAIGDRRSLVYINGRSFGTVSVQFRLSPSNKEFNCNSTVFNLEVTNRDIVAFV